jgi:hypothetical protein
MKKWLMTPLLAAGACAACCALPLLPSLLAGLLTTSLGTALIGWQPGISLGMGVASALALGARVWTLVRSRQHRFCRLPSNQDGTDTCATSPERRACGCRAGQVEASHACE